MDSVLPDLGRAQKLSELFSMGKFFYDDFKFEAANKYFDHARAVTIGSPKRDSAIFVSLYLASCKREMKDLPTARSIIYQSIEHLRNSRLDRADSLLAKAYDILASIEYVGGNYTEAIKNLELGVRTLKPSRRNNRQLNRFYSNAALIFTAMDRYKDALDAINQAILVERTLGGNRSDQMAIFALRKGQIYRMLNQPDSALFYYRMNLAIRQSVYGDKHANTWGAWYALGNYFYAEEQYDSSLYYHQKGITALISNFGDLNFDSNPVPDINEVNRDLTLALVAKGRALDKLGRMRGQAPMLQVALKTLLLADSTFQITRRNQPFDDSQLAQLEDEIVPYSEMIETAFYLSSTDSSYCNTAFEIMERSRAVLLLDALQRAEKFSKAGLPGDFKRQIDHIGQKRSAILTAINSVGARGMSDSLYKELLRVNDEQRGLEAEIESRHPAYYQTRFTSEPVSIEQFRETLSTKNAQFIEYHFSNKKIYAIAISKSNIRWKMIPVDDAFTRALSVLSKAITNTNGKTYELASYQEFCRASSTLYGLLLDGLVGTEEHLILSTSGKLANFPFEVLLTSEANPAMVNYNLPYLIKKYRVTYAHSATLLQMQDAKERKGSRLLAIGYGTSGEQSNFANLPATIEEVRSIANIMNRDENEIYVEENASESVFKKRVNDFNILHLATHGLADSVNALQSRLIFREAGDSLEDGFLYAHELYDVPLSQLDLAILSACESGIGKNQPGEGMMSVARGFAYSGCPSIVMSLWKIDDRTSAAFMENFYKHLQSGESLAQALSNSKIEYLATANELLSHPAYWASFIQIGNEQPLTTKTPIWKWIGFGIAAGLTLVLRTVYIRYQKKKELITENELSS